MRIKKLVCTTGLTIICVCMFTGCSETTLETHQDEHAYILSDELNESVASDLPEEQLQSNNGPDDKESEITEDTLKKYNSLLRVFNKDNNLDTEIYRNRTCVLAGNGFVFTQQTEDELSGKSNMNYYYYSLDAHEQMYLCTIEDWSYQCTYDDIMINNHLFSVISTGSLYDGTLKCYLYDFDLSGFTYERYDLPGTVPYCSLALLDDNLYIGIVGGEDYYVLRLDLQTKDITELEKKHYSKNNETNDVLRHIASEGDFLYLLRIRTKKGANSIAFLDKYGKDFDLIETYDITEYLHSTYVEEWMLDDELRQLVSHIDIKNDYMFYENFSMSRSLVHLNSNDTNVLIHLGPDDHKAISVDPNNQNYCYYETNGDTMYCVDTKTAETKEIPIAFDNKNLHVFGVSTDSLGNAMILLHNPNADGYDSIDELHFINIYR